MFHGLRALPILLKVLIANTVVVVTGAIVGTFLTIWVVQQRGADSAHWLVLPFATAGILLGMMVNYRLLRAAFGPLRALTRVADDVQRGDYSSRVHLGEYPDPELNAFANVFNRTLDVVERDRQQIRLLANRVTTAQEEERKRIARDLHDDTAQVLFGQLLRVAGMRSNAEPSVLPAIGAMEDALQVSIESVRAMATELRPPALDDLGLREALAGLCQRTEDRFGFAVLFRAEGPTSKITGDIALVLYRLAQESLMNIAKHAEAHSAEVTLVATDSEVTLSIEDDGRGFPTDVPKSDDQKGFGLGLFGMKERVDLVNGSLAIDGNRNPGTRIEAHIPLPSAHTAAGDRSIVGSTHS